MNDSFEVRLQDKALELLRADNDLAGEAPDLRSYYDQSKPKSKLGVVVQVYGLKNRNVGVKGGGTSYEAALAIGTHSIVSRDADGRLFERVSHRVRQIVEGWSTTPANLSTPVSADDASAGTLTMEGVIQADPVEIFDNDFVGRVQNVRLYFRRA